MPTLDLQHSPWIPVREADGTVKETGLRDALICAHELHEIRDPLPIVEFGLYRLLVALVMDIYQFRDLRDLEELLETGCFDGKWIDAYFAENADRFDLFHAQYPFLQFADLKSEADKPLSGLLPPVPSGTNVNHFYHAHEQAFSVCPEAAARLLTTLAPFMTAGGAGLAPSINGAPPWYALMTGNTLFHTICLNCCVIPLSQGNNGTPSWRRSGVFAQERRQSASLLEGLTWQPRRILLVPGDSGCCVLTGKYSDILISSMKFAPGAAAGFAWTDPNVAYRLDADSAKVLRPQEGKQIWRDVGPLALLHDEAHGQGNEKVKYARPRIVDQYADLYTDRFTKALVPESLCFTLYGMRTDLKMKVFEWQRENLEALPAPLVLQEVFGAVAQEEINRAGKVDSGIARALKCAYPRDGKGNKKAFDARIEYARRRFWNALRSDYMALLADLAKADPERIDEEKKPLVARWKAQLKKLGRQVLEEAISDLDTEANMLLRTEVVVRNEFRKALFFALEEMNGSSRKNISDKAKK
jgi:CRISPR system Cascade subunit CasA